MTRIGGAFVRVAFAHAISYPMSFMMSELLALVPILVYFFVARLVERSGASVGGDYFTFVVIGVVGAHALNGGLQGFGRELDVAIKQGRFEALLVEPIPWRAIPFGLAEWPILLRTSAAVIAAMAAVALGADVRPGGAIAALGLLVLGVLATLSIGIVAGSVKVLSKESDPVLVLYQLAAAILAGAFFPVSMLPSFVQPLSWAIPHTYALQAMRRVLMPGGGAMPGFSAGEAALALLAFDAVLLPLSLWLFGRSLEVGRRLGLLGGY